MNQQLEAITTAALSLGLEAASRRLATTRAGERPPSTALRRALARIPGPPLVPGPLVAPEGVCARTAGTPPERPGSRARTPNPAPARSDSDFV